MADYKLYDQQNHSVLIDPTLEKEKTFTSIEEAFAYNGAKNIGNYQIIKDSLPQEVRSSIEKNSGPIEYVNEREEDRGHFAITRNQKGTYDSLQVENLENGFQINIKSGFPDKEQAHNFTMNLQKHDIQKDISNDISR